jgi:hypothetical protein
MTMTLGFFSIVAGFILGITISKKAHEEQLIHLGDTIDEGYFQNLLLSGLVTILFHEHAENVFEVPVHGVIYKVFQRDKDIIYEKKA